jgi:hypothetical protein
VFVFERSPSFHFDVLNLAVCCVLERDIFATSKSPRMSSILHRLIHPQHPRHLALSRLIISNIGSGVDVPSRHYKTTFKTRLSAANFFPNTVCLTHYQIMTTNDDFVTISGQDAELLRKSIKNAQDHIHNAQGEIHRAQGCLNEINNLLSSRSANDTAASLTSPKSTVKITPKIPTIAPQSHDIKTRDATEDSLGLLSHFDGAESEGLPDVSSATDQAQTTENTRSRKARFSTTAMTEAENAFLRTQVGYTKKKRDASYFLQPVNHVALKLPTYPDVIKQPMDLSRVEAKLRNNEYASVQTCVDDLQLIVDNARKFNGPDHAITHAAYGMLQYVYERLETMSQHGVRRKRRGSLDD